MKNPSNEPYREFPNLLYRRCIADFQSLGRAAALPYRVKLWQGDAAAPPKLGCGTATRTRATTN